MTFSYTVDTPAGVRTGTTYLGPGNIQIVSGTWDNTAAGANTNGTIVTGLSFVMAYKTTVHNGTVTSEHTSKKNVDGSGTAQLGSIGILVIPGSETQNGNWFAIGY